MLKRYREIFNENTEADLKNQISNLVDKTVDDWIASLKKEIMTGTVTSNRGLWDRFKNFLSNIWYGYNDPRNPYYNINKYGYGLGSNVSGDYPARDKKPSLVMPPPKTEMNLSLLDYKILKETCDSLELMLNEDNQEKLRLFQIIDRHADELRVNLKKILVQQSKKYKMPDLCYQLSAEDKAKICAASAVTPPQQKQELPVAVKPKEEKPKEEKPKEEEEPKQEEPKQEEPKQEKPKEEKPKEEKPKEEEPRESRDFSYTEPPTQNKEWKDLTDDEKAAWNKYGGGISPRSQRIGSLAAVHGVSYPHILRIGDPRRKIFSQILDSQKNKNRSAMDHLKNSGRVELESDPITSFDDLEKRVNKLIRKKQKDTPEAEVTADTNLSPTSTNDKEKEKEIKIINYIVKHLNKHNLITDELIEIYNRLPDSLNEFKQKIKKFIERIIENLPDRLKVKYVQEYNNIKNLKDTRTILENLIYELYGAD